MPSFLRLTLLCLVAFSIAALSGCNKQAEADIRAAFDRWDQASGGANGDAAAAELASSAVAYWEAIRLNALDGTPESIAKLAPSDQAIIFEIRLAAKRADLKPIKDRAFYAWYIKNVSEADPPGTMKLKTIKITRDTALGELRSVEENPFYMLLDSGSGQTGRSADQAPKIMMRFERENGVWKVDDTSILEATDKLLTLAAQQTRMSIRDLIEFAYKDERGEPPPPNIWKPMK